MPALGLTAWFLAGDSLSAHGKQDLNSCATARFALQLDGAAEFPDGPANNSEPDTSARALVLNGPNALACVSGDKIKRNWFVSYLAQMAPPAVLLRNDENRKRIRHHLASIARRSRLRRPGWR